MGQIYRGTKEESKGPDENPKWQDENGSEKRQDSHHYLTVGQVHREGGAHPHLALHFNSALVLCHDFFSNDQTEAAAFTRWLGGEEGFEYTALDGLIDTATAIADRYHRFVTLLPDAYR